MEEDRYRRGDYIYKEEGGKMKERKEEDLKGLKFGIGKTRPDRTEGKR